MPERIPTKEKAPTRNEITSLGQRAVALLGERGPSETHNIFDDLRYGGLETHVAFFQPEEGVFLRVGTMQDWDGDIPRPDAHVVLIELDERHTEDEVEGVVAKETTHDFSTGGFSRYTVTATEAVVVYDQSGLPICEAHTAGWMALKSLGFQNLSRAEYKVLKEVLKLDFDREKYSRISQLIALCGPHNRVQPESGDNNDKAG